MGHDENWLVHNWQFNIKPFRSQSVSLFLSASFWNYLKLCLMETPPCEQNHIRFWKHYIPLRSVKSVEFLFSRIAFSAGCMIGVSEGCGGEVIALGWLNFSFALLGALTFSTLMRYSEGSNYVIIVLVTNLFSFFSSIFHESEKCHVYFTKVKFVGNNITITSQTFVQNFELHCSLVPQAQKYSSLCAIKLKASEKKITTRKFAFRAVFFRTCL